MIKIKTDDNGCENLIYNGIVFDDFVGGDDGLWSQICENCLFSLSDGQIKAEFVDDCGSGICGVKGCDYESTHYIDFPQIKESEARVMKVENNPTLEKNIEIVADWIENDSNDRKKEIKWLLSKLFAEQVEWVPEADHIRTLNEDITNVYASVMEHSESEANK